jgi:hypothetical protein
MDEHGAIHHQHVKLCPIGGVAMLLWAMFHLQKLSVPNFEPDFLDCAFGEFRHCDWYEHHLFFASTSSPANLM